MEEYILSAAIYFNDGKEYPGQPNNIKTGFVVTGRRHHNCYATLAAVGKALDLEERALVSFERIDRDIQGFVTNIDRFVDRRQGWLIAIKANQVKKVPDDVSEGNILFSEDLY
jgi:hypothetical protein